jgi:hypothetical protein
VHEGRPRARGVAAAGRISRGVFLVAPALARRLRGGSGQFRPRGWLAFFGRPGLEEMNRARRAWPFCLR